MGLADLPLEILSQVFLELDFIAPEVVWADVDSPAVPSTPAVFSLVNKSFHAIAVDRGNVARLLLATHGRVRAIPAALQLPRLFDRPLLNALVARGAHLSHAFALPFYHSSLAAGTNFTKRLSVDAVAAVLELWHSTYSKRVSGIPAPDVSSENEGDVFMWIYLVLASYRCHSRLLMPIDHPDFVPSDAALEAAWVLVHSAFADHGFMPHHNVAVFDLQFARMAILQPRFRKLLCGTGLWAYTDEIRDALARCILFDPDDYPVQWTDRQGNFIARSRSQIIFDDLVLLIRAPEQPLVISSTVVGEALTGSCTPTRQSRDVLEVLSRLEKEGHLHLKIRDVVHDLLRLAHHTDCTILHGRWIEGLVIQWLEIDDVTPVEVLSVYLSALRVMYFPLESGTFSRPPAVRFVIDKIKSLFHRLDRQKTVDVVVDMLCDPFATSLRSILALYVDVLATGTPDVVGVVERAAVRMVRLPYKGSHLLELVKLYPFLKSVIRTSILKHRIISSKLPAPLDPSRSIYSPFPHFLSPLAFDYSAAATRYPVGLGPDPWVETCYVSSVPPRVSSESETVLSTSIWPATTAVRTVIISEEGASMTQELRLGRVTGALSPFMPDAEDRWFANRVPALTLPVAIALLDIFDRKDDALDIFLMHAILNFNVDVTDFYLREGVPLRSHHTKIMTALHYPEFECIKLHLAKKSEGLQSVPAEPSGKTNRRGGKSRRKAQGSGEAVQPAVVVI